MNKSSRFFWFLVLAQAFVVVLAIELRIIRGQHPHIRLDVVHGDIRGGLKTALESFAVECGRYPTTAEGLQALITRPPNIPSKLWPGPYLDQIPKDTSGHEFVYRYPGIYNTNGYDLYSTGPDNINIWRVNSFPGGVISTHTSLFDDITPFLLVIPLVCGICSVTKNYSPRVRDFFDRNHTAHFVWIITSLMALMLFLLALVPRISG